MFNRKKRTQFKEILRNGKPPEMVWRTSWFNLNAKEGGLKPVFGLQITRVCITLYLFTTAIRFRHGFMTSLPMKVYLLNNPIRWPKDTGY